MIEEITVYKTDDGELIESREMAIKNDKELRQYRVVEKWIKDNLDPETLHIWDEHGTDVEAVPVWYLRYFIVNHGEFLDAINKFMARESDNGIAGLLEHKTPPLVE